MRVLITNDDGIHEPGLRALVTALLHEGYDVVVVAPSGQWSGSGASLGVVEHAATVPVSRVSLPGLEGVPAFAVHAPPALSVRAACTGAFGPVPDLVVSGVNPGYNVGRLVFHSGTIGAALTAASLAVCGLAVSTGRRTEQSFRTAADVARHAVHALSADGTVAPPPVALNLNVPEGTLFDLAGVEEATMSGESLIDVAFMRGTDELVVQRTTNQPPFTLGTDSYHLSRGSVSISSLPLPWRASWDTTELVAALRSRLFPCSTRPAAADLSGS